MCGGTGRAVTGRVVTGGEAIEPPRSFHAFQPVVPAVVWVSAQMSLSKYCAATWIRPSASCVNAGLPVNLSLPEMTVHCTELKLPRSSWWP
jgi:hypothetical protein